MPPSAVSPFYHEKWLSQRQLFDTISLQSRVCVTLWDVSMTKFLYATDKVRVLGDHASHFTEEGGVDYTVSKIHPDYLQGVLMAQQKSMEFFFSQRHLLPNNITVNLDTLYEKEGSWIHILQQAMPVETGENGHPLLFLCYIHDISHLKKEPSCNLVVTTPENVLLWNYSFEKKEHEEVRPITSTEQRILALLGEGKQTRQIAEAMFSSPHTVDTHRRNLLAKTNCVDTTALVTYARMVGLL